MPSSKNGKQLKNLLLGCEIEAITINNQGQVVDKADLLFKELKKYKPEVKAEKECAKHMVELISSPFHRIDHTMNDVFSHLESTLLLAQKHDVSLLPLGTYPGKTNPTMREDKKYKVKEYIFGKNRFKIAGRSYGFHCHFTLPKGTFDRKQKFLKTLVRSTGKDHMMHSYNMLIAMDPALTTLMQCSPFYEGKNLGKDSRMIVYRGGDFLKNKQALYAHFEDFGELPPYKTTSWDLLNIITKRYKDWILHIKNLGINIQTMSQYGSTLDTTWNPVKVNPNGTLEQRGMDMNHPPYILAAAILIKRILRYIQEQNITVVPSDIGIKEPFKMEGNVIYIAPHSHVRRNLQYDSAYHGLDSKEIVEYCKRLVRLGKSLMPKDRLKLVEPFDTILKNKKTVSDEILDQARKKGWRKGATLTTSAAQEIALNHSQRLYKELVYTRKLLSGISG